MEVRRGKKRYWGVEMGMDPRLIAHGRVCGVEKIEREERAGRFGAADYPRNHWSRYSRQRDSLGVIKRNEKNRS